MESVVSTILIVAGSAIAIIYGLTCLVQILAMRQKLTEKAAYDAILKEELLTIEHLENKEKRENELHKRQLLLLERQLNIENLKEEKLRREIDEYRKVNPVEKQSFRGDGIRGISQVERGTYMRGDKSGNSLQLRGVQRKEDIKTVNR